MASNNLFFLSEKYILKWIMCLGVEGCVHISVGTLRGQKRVLDPLELEF